MTTKRTALAPAKINLTLHVTGQRPDGYHLLDSLVAFANIGDQITVSSSDDLTLTADGPFGAEVPTDDRNLMLKAAALFGVTNGAALHLTKNLPPASGIGGGSSDAATTLRLLADLWQKPLPQSALSLGADLPVCLDPIPQRMSGIGDVLTAVPNLPACDILLVNPGFSVSTPAIFHALTQRDNPAMPKALPNWRDAPALAAWLKSQRNDMQAAATTLAPEIKDVLAALSKTDSLFSQMSGSGATCFALYPPNGRAAWAAAARLRSSHSTWWIKPGTLLT